MAGTVPIPIEVARIIDRAFLPTNPNKMRNAHPDVVAAVRQFKALVAATPPTPDSERDGNG